MAASAPALATVEQGSALGAYLRARVAGNGGDFDRARQGYAAALALEPGNMLLAQRAMEQAIAAGDWTLALKAARLLEAAGSLSGEGRFLLLGDALRERQWRQANVQIEALAKDEVFAFAVPVLRAWAAQGSGKGKPFSFLTTQSGSELSQSYIAEHRALLLLATGNAEEGREALASFIEEETIRTQRLRILAATLLVRRGRKAEALALLDGDASSLTAARARLAAKRPPDAPLTAAAGFSELLLRMATELQGEQVPGLALSLARLATFANPKNGAAQLVLAETLAQQGRHEAALAVLGSVVRDDPFAGDAAERRVGILVAADRSEEALAQAKAATVAEPAAVDHWTRLGDIYGQMTRYAEAAEAYGKALELAKGGAEGGQPLWGLWLLRGSALTQAGKWPEGKAALEEALKLGPTQAVVLNYLGYSQLERRENLAEAERLIAEASKLQPDDPAITDSLGWAHYVRGNYPKAIELLERAARGQPSDAAINEHLGDAYYSAGRRFEARHAWAAALVYAEGEPAARLRAKIEKGLRPELAAP
ncbi:MAG TPA: tetratricopeptide repeat protein [Allosphingosinicella sp.]